MDPETEVSQLADAINRPDEAALTHAEIPQSEPLDDKQVLNNAGGFVYTVDDFTRLRRFIILGSNGNNYYVSGPEIQLENCDVVLRLLEAGHGLRVVAEATQISKSGRAPRQSTGILVLALCASLGDVATRRAAMAALPAVCRTASTLFEFVQRRKELGPVARAVLPNESAADSAGLLAKVKAWQTAQKAAAAAAAATAIEAAAAVQAAAAAAAAEAATAVEAAVESTTDGAVAGHGAGGCRGGGRLGGIIGGRGRGRGGGRGGGRRGGRSQLAGPATAATDGKASWGRSMRRAVALWYLEKSPAAVAYQATKYSQRHGWSHADLLRLAHPDPEEHAAKRRKLAGRAAEAKAEAEAAAEGGAVTGADAAAAGPVEAATDGDWVLVSEKVDEAEGDGDGQASELGALAAALAAVEVAVPADGDEAAVADAVEAQRVADMKAIFDYLTHGTLPGQDRPLRRAKAKVAAHNGGDEGCAGSEEQAPAPAGAAAAASATNEAAVTPAANASAAAAAPLSPVMQYLVDANRLRKEIRMPPPLVKPARPTKPTKRRRGAETESEPEAAEATQPPPDPAAVAAHAAAAAAAVETAVSLVRRHRFGHEHVGDTALLRAPELWSTFLEMGMPLTALVRNLGRMTQLGVMARPDCLARVTSRLTDGRALAAARLHPMTLLDAMCTYRAGAGARGVARWEAVPELSAALEAAFYLAFKNCRPTGQRYLAGLDVSGSMSYINCAGMTSVDCRQAAAAMLMSLVRTEPSLQTVAFSTTLTPMELKPNDKLVEVLNRIAAIPMGGTDCAAPIMYALEQRIPVDVFLVLTDNETWFGKVHPAQALRRYREEMGLPGTKLVVLGFAATAFSIADPADPGMLDVAGLDSAVPELVADFARGQL